MSGKDHAWNLPITLGLVTSQVLRNMPTMCSETGLLSQLCKLIMGLHYQVGQGMIFNHLGYIEDQWIKHGIPGGYTRLSQGGHSRWPRFRNRMYHMMAASRSGRTNFQDHCEEQGLRKWACQKDDLAYAVAECPKHLAGVDP